MDHFLAGLKLVIGFCFYILRGVLIAVLSSAILFVATVSILTQKFPPDFSFYVQKVTEVQSLLRSLSPNKSATDSEEPLQVQAEKKTMLTADEMIQLQKHREKLGRDIAEVVGEDLGMNGKEMQKKIDSLEKEIDRLKNRIQILESQK